MPGPSQDQKASPQPIVPKPQKKSPKRQEIVKKTQPDKVKSVKTPLPKKKLVPLANKLESPPEPVDPQVELNKEVVEDPVQPQQAKVTNSDSDQKEEPETENQQPPQKPQAMAVLEAVPLFRLTRMPKILDYNLETLKRFYPKEERDFGKEATVEAMILVDENGNVVDVQIIKSAGERFDAAAKKALLSKALIIQPGYMGDRPVASRVPIPITFSLTN